MFNSLTILLITISAAILGGIEGWYWFRSRHYKKLIELYDEKEAALKQLNHAYATVNNKYSDLQNKYTHLQSIQNEWESKNKQLTDELDAAYKSRAALVTEFNAFRMVSLEKTTALETSIKNLNAEFDAKYNALSKEYADAVAERKTLHATASNLINDKQTLISEYGNFRTETNFKYNTLKTHLDKLQNPYAAYADENFSGTLNFIDEGWDTQEKTNDKTIKNQDSTFVEKNNTDSTLETDANDNRNYDAITIIDDNFEPEEERDNLQRIEGIGPKIAEILNRNGIETFAQLAATDTQRLRDILHTAGTRFRMHDPVTWATQAAFARDKNWNELKVFQDKINMDIK